MIFSFAFPLMLAISGAPAEAEEPHKKTHVGSRFKKNQTKAKGGRYYMNLYAKCVEGRHRKTVEEILKMESFSKTQFDGLTKIAGLHGRSSCLQSDIAYNPVTFRGAVAEHWYLSRHSSSAPELVSGSSPYLPDLLLSVNRIVAAPTDARGQMIVEEFASCVTALQPMKVDSLLRTVIGSDEEKDMISQLSPDFGKCAIEGQKLKFNYESLRSGLSYSLARKALGIVPEPEKPVTAEAVE